MKRIRQFDPADHRPIVFGDATVVPITRGPRQLQSQTAGKALLVR